MPSKTVAVVALMAVFSLAVCFIILGAISSDLQTALNIDDVAFGSLVMTLLLTSCVVQLFVGPAVDRFGYRPLAIVGFLVASGSMFLLAFAGSLSVAFVACMILGVGAMALNTSSGDNRFACQPSRAGSRRWAMTGPIRGRRHVARMIFPAGHNTASCGTQVRKLSAM